MCPQIGTMVKGRLSNTRRHRDIILPTARIGIYSDVGEIEAFHGEWLISLIDYDCQHGTDTVRTLGAHLRWGRNQQATAKKRLIHVSTTRYPLHRTRENNGMPVSDHAPVPAAVGHLSQGCPRDRAGGDA